MSGSLTTAAPAKPSLLRRLAGGVLSLGVLAGVGMLATMALSGIYAAAESNRLVNPTPPLEVATAKLSLASGYESAETFIGRVEPAQTTALAFETGGSVIAILVDEGDIVPVNGVVAMLDQRALTADRNRLLAERKRLEKNLGLAKRTFERQRKLSGDGFSSTQKRDEAETNQEVTAAAIEVIDAQLAALQVRVDKSTIRAPFAGVVATRSADKGAIVSAGQPIVSLMETKRPVARIGVTPAQVAQLKRGAAYDIVIRGRSVSGRLTTVLPNLDTTTQTVAALFELDLAAEGATKLAAATSATPKDSLMLAPFGEVARLRLPLKVATRGAWAPLSALQEDAKGLWRLLIIERPEGGDPIIGATAVRVVHVEGERAFIAGALPDGVEYVREGVNRVVIGDVVAPKATQ